MHINLQVIIFSFALKIITLKVTVFYIYVFMCSITWFIDCFWEWSKILEKIKKKRKKKLLNLFYLPGFPFFIFFFLAHFDFHKNVISQNLKVSVISFAKMTLLFLISSIIVCGQLSACTILTDYYFDLIFIFSWINCNNL